MNHDAEACVVNGSFDLNTDNMFKKYMVITPEDLVKLETNPTFLNMKWKIFPFSFEPRKDVAITLSQEFRVTFMQRLSVKGAYSLSTYKCVCVPLWNYVAIHPLIRSFILIHPPIHPSI